MHVAELVIYPIKSLRGISVASSQVEKRGLRYDRRWMLVDSEGVFLTQRKLFTMALFDVALGAEGLEVSFRGTSIHVPFEPATLERQVQVWRSTVTALSVSREVDAWFSEALNMPCGLVYMPETSIRRVPSAGAKSSDIVSFADANPILIAGQASIDDLNSRLENPIPIRRFRPNIVVEGSNAYEEDDWSVIRVGELDLRKTTQCGRCAVPTIDIETGIPSDEPLRTLNTYRRFGQKVCFGTYYVPDKLGTIRVGDAINRA
ncbi:MAG: MOSC domain-containing protein [Fimbriimonas sp.]